MNKSQKGKTLTAELIFAKTKSDSLHNIKNLNLWGTELQDIQIIQKMPNLQVISLSVNKISSLKDFAKCNKLRVILFPKSVTLPEKKQYFRYQVNFIYHESTLAQNFMAQRQSLCLSNFFFIQIPNYRQLVINNLPNLVKLDNKQITHEERTKCHSVSTNHSIPQQQITPNNLSIQKSIYKQRREQMGIESKWVKKNSQRRMVQEERIEEEEMNKNQNILMAIISLMRQLDKNSLQILRRQSDKMFK